MKLRKIIIALFFCAIIILSSGSLFRLDAITQNIMMEENLNPPPHKKDKDILQNSIKELKDSGVLNEEDITNIKKFNDKKIEEMKNKRYSIIDEMIEEKVITKEKGEKIKETIDKKIQEDKK